VPKILKSRDFLLMLAIVLGLFMGQGARWTRDLVIPGLAVIMTLAVMTIPGSIFRSPRSLVWPTLTGLVLNYALHGGVILGLSHLLIREEALRAGFVLVAAAPPAVAVIPFTVILKGDVPFSLVATVGCYLGALMLMPLITFGWLGAGFAPPGKLAWIMLELIIAPLAISRVLRRSGFADRLRPYQGPIINWSFFLVIYTIIGLNRAVFLDRPLSILPVFLVALTPIFLLGFIIERIGRRFLRIDPAKRLSLVLLVTQKNTGLAAGLALTLLGERTALPATVSTVFMIVYIVWLSLRRRGEQKDGPR
jgi:BASS family bile acid:Na+ symporter